MDIHVLTKCEVKDALGLAQDAQLGKLLGVTRAAVSLWPDDKPLPLARRFQLALMRPDLFQASPTKAA
jgi:hypothetical protein